MSRSEKPNILWVCTDQQRYDTISALGNVHVRTPNADRLIDSGIAFTHAYCQCPVCTPSRGSFLSGRYPSTTRLRQNGQQIPSETVLVTRLLAEAGYACGLAGKLHLGPCQGSAERRIDDGYTEFYWSHSNFPKWPENQYTQWLLDELGLRWEDTYTYSLEEVASAGPTGGVPYGNVVWAGQPKGVHQSKWCADRAIDFMKRHRQGPWLMSVNFFDPHHPFDPPQEYLDRYESIEMPLPAYKPGELDDKPEFQRIDHQGAYGGAGLSFADTTDQEHQRITAAYYAMIENVDANLGRMLDYLEDSGEAENTIVIFMSDHGEMLGDHGIYLKGPYMYDAVTRVPLVVSFPARYRGGIKNDALVELVDLAPTLMEAAGLEIPRGMQGKSLDSLCRGMAEWEDHRQNVYCEYFNAMPEHRNPLPFLASVRDREYKVVVYADAEYGELYDLTQDPGEHHNLWNHPGYQDVRASYVKKCLDRILLATDPLPERTAKF